jgi:hypothetical protein
MMLQKFQASSSTLAKLVERDPGNTVWQSTYAWSQRMLANAVETSAKQLESGLKLDVEISTMGLFESALNGYNVSASNFAALAAQESDNTDFKRDFATSTRRAAGVLEKLGRRDEALADYRSALAVTQELTHLDPTNTTWADDLAIIKRSIARLEQEKTELQH